MQVKGGLLEIWMGLRQRMGGLESNDGVNMTKVSDILV
jgi:hypothetical protein